MSDSELPSGWEKRVSRSTGNYLLLLVQVAGAPRAFSPENREVMPAASPSGVGDGHALAGHCSLVFPLD